MRKLKFRILSLFVLITFFFSSSISPVLAAITYTYDQNGNMTSNGTNCYEYNEANQLKKVKTCSNSQTIAEYLYDSEGTRIIKKEYENGNLKKTIYSPADEFETVKDASSGATQNTTYYKANDETVAKKNPDGTITYYHNDHLGSSAVLSNQTGALLEKTTYEPYGEVKSGGTLSKFQYTGQEKDNETGLNYYGARYYDSRIQRFIQADTYTADIYDPQDLNEYSYVKNNPIRYTDPTGHYIETGLDIVFISMDINDIRNDPTNLWNWAALAGDALGTVTPGLTGVGLGIKIIEHGGDVKKVIGSSDVVMQATNKLTKQIQGSAGGLGAGKNFSQKLKDNVLKQLGGCVFCGTKNAKMEVDHIIPKSKGGNNTPANAQKACVHCNRSKGNDVAPKSPPKNYKESWPPSWWPIKWRK